MTSKRRQVANVVYWGLMASALIPLGALLYFHFWPTVFGVALFLGVGAWVALYDWAYYERKRDF